MKSLLTTYGALSVLVGLALLQAPAALRGQTSFGTILGTVTDQSAGAIPAATVTVTNEETGISREVRSGQDGGYRVPSLLPGMYSVRVSLEGFQTTDITGVELQVTRAVTVNAVLELGAVTETVEVVATTPLLDTADATVGTVVNNDSVISLPLNGRSYTDLILLVPGAVPRGKLFAISGGHNFSVSGNSPDVNNFTLDGIQNNDLFFKAFGTEPSIDAIQEFRVQTNITSAEFGSGAGANVAVALKSGTNELHGSFFEFLRNDKLDANDFFRNARGTGKPAFRQNQWGMVLGGPVKIPGVYDGRNKSFWLFNYEGFKTRRASTLLATVPTNAQLSGDLQDLEPIFDPYTSRLDPASGLVIRDRLTCNGVPNVICPSRIHPATSAWADIVFPKTDTPGGSNIVNTNPRELDQYQLNMRGDYRATDDLSLFMRYSPSIAQEAVPQGLPSMATITTQRFHNAVISGTYVPTPTTVIDAKVGFNRTGVLQAASNPGPGAAAFLQQYPLQGVIVKSPSHPLFPGLGLGEGFTGTFSSGTLSPTNDMQYIFKVSNVRGKHTIKVGFSIDNIWGVHDNLNETSFSFTRFATADPQNAVSTGSSLASFLLGLPDGGNRRLGDTSLDSVWNMYHFYVNDDFRVAPRLTLNLGLRYEYTELPRDRDDRLSQFDRHDGKFVWAGVNPLTGEPPNTVRTIREPDYNNFAPRVGLAFTLNDKTTVRAGYGVFYIHNYLWELQAHRGQWPYALSQGVSVLNRGTSLTPIDAMFSADTSVTPGTIPSVLWSADRKDRFGYTQQWNIGVQRELADELMLEVGYVGSKGTKVPIFSFQNLPPPGPGVVGCPPSPCEAGQEHPRPFPINNTFMIVGENKATSNYHSLQAKLEKRFSSGLQFLGSYAWGHHIDVGGSGNSTQSFPQDQRNLRGDRASGFADFRHVFTGSYLYELPFGKGKRFLTDASAFVNTALGGWAVSGITRYTTGAPVNVRIDFDRANIGFGSFQRPDRVLDRPARVRSSGDKTQGWLNPEAFAVPEQYRFGNLGRNTERGPAFGNWDIILFKNFALPGERMTLQFRTEYFNAFNTVNLANPSSGSFTRNPNFGHILGTQNAARQIQFGLKLLF
jgi:hypothetical protein